ncbi:hypothetical protein N665_2069s0008 [Sinapis alba]|nr:hypothetical protein N665_2069s0008 [Sinapis alba]
MEPLKDQHTPEKSSTEPPSGCCTNCGRPTISEPSPLASLPEMSPPPNYRPIPALAINLPHNSQAIILSPVPHAEQVPVVSPPYQFECPVKRIHSPDDIRRFKESPSFKNFLGFIVSLSESIRGHKILDPCHVSPTVAAIVSVLETLLQWIDEIPPRHERLAHRGESLILELLLPDEFKGSTIKIVPYFFDSFGNSSRINYGTWRGRTSRPRMRIIKEEDYHGVVARVFVKYLELMRKLQMVYCLEPTGSDGLWGLDDYHFLPFIFGSSQLINHKYMKPKSIHNDDILENFSSEYMYLSCIAFVKKVKKVNSGMLKMYKVDVLEKVPIMQHFLFGWLIKWYDSSFLLSRFSP